MARPLRVQYPGAIYHVCSRMLGDSRSALFRDDRDRERYLTQLEARVEEFGIRLYLFVLMRNHVHLVFETPKANCSRFMHGLSTAYTVYFNLRHGRHGHLLDGRFKSKLVESDPDGRAGDYLLSLTRYVHLNPAYIGTVRRQPLSERIQVVRGHRWSSYPGYIGQAKPFAFVDSAPVFAAMGGRSPREQRRRYRDFVETGLADTDEDFREALNASPRSIGEAPFRHWVDGQHTELLRRYKRPEDVAFRHVTEVLSPALVLQLSADALGTQPSAFRERLRNSPLRAVAASMLSRFSGLTQREIAEELHMGTGSAVSQQRQRLPALLEGDRALRKAVKGLEKELTERTGMPCK